MEATDVDACSSSGTTLSGNDASLTSGLDSGQSTSSLGKTSVLV
jgi:hypothetical protein